MVLTCGAGTMSDPNNLPSQVTFSQDAISQIIGDSNVWLEMSKGQYYSTDPVGLRVWELLTETNGDVTATLAKMLDEYDVNEAQLRADVADFIAALEDANLVIVP
jgi:hypothetical protein